MEKVVAKIRNEHMRDIHTTRQKTRPVNEVTMVDFGH
jgi:hypothetical protein